MKKIILLSFSIALVTGCSSKPLNIVSEPDQAEVFVVDSEGGKKSLGLTPIRKTKKELKPILAGNSPGELVNILISKDGFASKNIWLPLNAGGNLGAQLNLSLDKGLSSTTELNTASEILRQLFKAQQFARTEQLERALIEVDRILEKYPKFERAMTMKAAILYGKGQFKESLKWYESAVDLNPELKSAIEMSGKIRKTLKLPVRIPASKTINSAKKNKSGLQK